MESSLITHNLLVETLNDNITYLTEGLSSILRSENPGYSGAFLNKIINENGAYFTSDAFLAVLKSQKMHFEEIELPSEFLIRIKFSPIALFKKWIFTITNHDFLKVSERAHEFSHEFFILHEKKSYTFTPMITNAAHEKFLVMLYKDNHFSNEFTTRFTTNFDKSGRLVLYKDYPSRRVSGITLKQTFIVGKPYPVVIKVLRDEKSIRFRVKVNNKPAQLHQIKVPGTIKKIDLSSDDEEPTTEVYTKVEKRTVITTKPEIRKALKITNKQAKPSVNTDYRSEVITLINHNSSAARKTNNSANIALGRVAKVPVLVNLPTRYKNVDVYITVDKSGDVYVKDEQKNVIKMFKIAENPRSNWLEKK